MANPAVIFFQQAISYLRTRGAVIPANDLPLSWPGLTRPSSNLLKARSFSWMAASSAAMTAELFRERQIFSPARIRESMQKNAVTAYVYHGSTPARAGAAALFEASFRLPAAFNAGFT
jgi:hypothetical protein